MRIAVITGMHPTVDSPNGGIFVAERVHGLRTLGHDVELMSLTTRDSRGLNVARRMFGNSLLAPSVTPARRVPGHDIEFESIVSGRSVPSATLDRLSGWWVTVQRGAHAICERLGQLPRVDVIHAHWGYPTGASAVLAGQRLGVPVIVTCHGSDINIVLQDPAVRRRMVPLLSAAAGVEYVSQALRATAERAGIAPARTYVVPNGIRDVRAPAHQDRPRAGSPVLGFVGNLSPVKGADRLPKILEAVMTAGFPEATLRIVGDGPLRPVLEGAAAHLPIELIGQIPHDRVLEEMASMDVLVLPSRNEGWPCVVLEAHSTGTPVVGCDVGGVGEAIGQPELVVSAGTSLEEEIGSRIAAVLRGDLTVSPATLVARADTFRWSILAQRTVTAYSDLIGDHHAARL